MQILLIEDDREAASYLMQGRSTRPATSPTTPATAKPATAWRGMDYDVLIVDRMLPRRDGLSIVDLRAEGDHTPVLILSALGEVDDRVTGLRAGGDDYLVKPYAFSELLARVEVLARRCEPGRSRDAATSRRPRTRPAPRTVERDGKTIPSSRASSACSNT